MMNKNIFAATTLLFMGVAFNANAQSDVAVAGSVKDVYGNPLPGVVLTSNHKGIYVTDKNGNYAVMADKSESITFSLAGYKQVTVTPSERLDIVLEDDAHDLAEKINLGISSQYKEVLSDAVSSVDGKTLGKSLMSRLQGTLSGQFSGLATYESSFEPTKESLSMYIRGISTHHGTAPAVVIDGILYDEYCHDILYRITPGEIESISVLKDAGAQAIYGNRGAHGVIVITTKRGTPGKLKLGVNVSQTIEQPSNIVRAADSWEYATLRNQAAENDGRGKNFYYSNTQIWKMKEGGNPLYPNTDWMDKLVRPVSDMQRVDIDATGGNKIAKYYANVNFLRQGGIFNTDQDDYNANNSTYRINFRSNVDININSWISAWMNLAGSVVKNHKPAGGVTSIYNMATYFPSTIYGPTTPTIFDSEGNVVDEGGNVIVTERFSNSPYGELNRSGYRNETNTNIYGQGGIRLDLSFVTPGLWLGGSVGYLSYITATMNTTQSYARYIRDNDWSKLNFSKFGTTQNTPLAYGKGTALYGYQSYKGEGGWTRDFGKHHIDVNAYATYQVFDDNTGNVAASYDHRRVYTGAEAKYDYDKRYALKLAAGYSGSDCFPRENRFVLTPSVSAAWIASNESFVKDNAPWISMLKVRGSYGITANDAIGYDRYIYRDQVRVDNGGTIGYLLFNTTERVYGNADLAPEKVTKYDIGLDLGLFNQFQVSVDYYNEHMDNGVGRSTAYIPAYQGIALGSYPVTNFVEYKNWGWDLSVGYHKRFNENWTLFANGHLEIMNNKIINIGESELDEDYAYRYRQEGYPYGQSWGYLVDYSNGNGLYNFQEEIDAGPEYSFGTPRLGDIKYKDLNEDGIIDDKDKAPIGNGFNPKFSYGLNLGFSYKNLEVSMLFQGYAKYDRDYMGVYTAQTSGEGAYAQAAKYAWTPERWLNDEKIDWPALSASATTNGQTNEYFFKDNSFVRLKNVEISYKLPKKVCDFLNAGEFRVYVGGQNLFTIDGMKYRDMYVEGSTFEMPIYRMYRFGINLTF